MKKVLENVSRLILEVENDLGARDLSYLVLKSLQATVKDLKVSDEHTLCDQFHAFSKVMQNTKPRIGIIIEYMYQITKAIEKAEKEEQKKNATHKLKCEHIKQVIVDTIDTIFQQEEEDNKALLNHSLATIQNGDSILLHTHSHSVFDVLKENIKLKKFSCIVAEQEFEKTQRIISDLHKANIPFRVVPEYMLSHIEREVNKVFLGAVTLNSLYQIVSNAGTMSIVSEFHGKCPIYLFMSTRKFSFWKAEETIHAYKEFAVKSHADQNFNYSRIKFSHDRIPLDMFEYIVTEKDVFTTGEMKQWYDEEYKRREKWRKAVGIESGD